MENCLKLSNGPATKFTGTEPLRISRLNVRKSYWASYFRSLTAISCSATGGGGVIGSDDLRR